MLMAEGAGIVEFLEKEKDTVTSFVQSIRTKDKIAYTATATHLLVSVATGIPALGMFFSESFRAIWAQSSYAKLEAYLRELELEEKEEVRMRKVALFTATLINEALVGFAQQQREELASRNQVADLEKKLEGFAQNFRDHIQAKFKLVTGGGTGAEVESNHIRPKDVRLEFETVSGNKTTGLKIK